VEVWWGGEARSMVVGGIIAAGRVNTDVMLSEKSVSCNKTLIYVCSNNLMIEKRLFNNFDAQGYTLATLIWSIIIILYGFL